ncbi:MAG TPA: hypothetical protein VKM72_24820 [Thermoanaerobaculia bacterium]|nr:hypothetical protein [Thermoanaerobaculia bacterium]
MSQIARMRSGLREAAENLQETREKLLGLLNEARSGAPPEDDGDAEPHPLSEMTAVIECGVHDNLNPLIQSLLTASV